MQIIHCSWPWPGNCVYITQTSYFVILQGLYPAGTFTLMKWIKTLCGIDSRSYIKLWRHWALLCSVILIPWRQLQSVKRPMIIIGWQNLNPLSHPNATLAPQARQAGQVVKLWTTRWGASLTSYVYMIIARDTCLQWRSWLFFFALQQTLSWSPYLSFRCIMSFACLFAATLPWIINPCLSF